MPVRRLIAQDDLPAGLRFANDEVTVVVEALRPDLFRLRASPRGFRPTPSWAVLPQESSPPEVVVRRSGAKVELTTVSATLAFDLRSGAWQLRDHHGLELFASPAGARVTTTTPPNRGPSLQLRLVPREHLFGLGETTGTFDRRGTIREFWNIDVLGHAPAIHPHLRRLYVSIPFALSLRDGRAAGLFWDNPARQVWDLGSTQRDVWSLAADSGEIDLYLFTGPRVAEILNRYTELTGRQPLPPRWALGYHQCRYSYETRAELERIAAEFRRRHLPCDALYLDIHHMDGYRVFTFGKRFPRPKEMITRLARRGFKLVTIVDPGVKDDRKFPVLQRGRKLGAFVRDKLGRKDFLGEVWPGRSRFPDFLNERTRRWWGEEQRALLDLGVAGFWNDMNEPANFARPDKTLDPECLHRTDHGRRRHAEVHNVYGQEMVRASRDGALLGPTRPPGPAPARTRGRPFPTGAVDRPFIITRAGYAGIQRQAIVWTGDNSASWEHLADAVQMLQNLGLSGVAMVGADVGGFLENTTPELFVRWLQMAVFTPFLRNHSNLGTTAQEPWAFGEEIETIVRSFLNLRYQLLPYLYGLLAQASTDGTPILRPMLWHHANDPVAALASDQFLLGERLLVAPILRSGAVARSVYLPRGLWYDFWTGTKFDGGTHVVAQAPLERIPLFVRAGAILPMTTVRPWIGKREPDTVILHLWPGDAGELHWYDDDGRTEAYRTGAVQQRRIRLDPRHRGGRLTFEAAQGPYRGQTRRWRVLMHQADRPSRVRVDGTPIPAEYIPELRLLLFDVPDRRESLDVHWT